MDRSVGVSHYTGAITHHIDADIDLKRQTWAGDLEGAGMVTAKYQVTGIGHWPAAMAAATSTTPTAKCGSSPGRGLPEEREAGQHPAEPTGDGDQGSDLAGDRRDHEELGRRSLQFCINAPLRSPLKLPPAMPAWPDIQTRKTPK
jgi:hypothetical protein